MLSDESYTTRLSEIGFKYVKENFGYNAVVNRLLDELSSLNYDVVNVSTPSTCD